MAFTLQYVDTVELDAVHSRNPRVRAASAGTACCAARRVVFFAYIGFDAVSTAAQEAKNPQRDMPIGILGSLFICTLIYIAMSAVMTGIMPYTLLGTPKPVATALENYPNLLWLKSLVEIGAIAGLTSVILVMTLGQPRIFYSMARDGLIPPIFGRIHPEVPHAARRYRGRRRHRRDPRRACCRSACSATWCRWARCSPSRRSASAS